MIRCSRNRTISVVLVLVYLLALERPCSSDAYSIGTHSSSSIGRTTTTRNRHRRRHLAAAALPDWDTDDGSSGSSSSSYGSQELSDEDEELIRLIRGPMGARTPRPKPKTIVIISDTTGVTAKAAVERSLAQFNGCDERYVTYVQEDDDDDDDDGLGDDEDCENLSTRLYPFIHNEAEIAPILKTAQKRTNTMVVFTLSDPVLRESTSRMCDLSGLPYVDLLGPMFNTMATFFDRQPLGSGAVRRDRGPPGKRRALSDDYYRRIEAVEFTLKCDDGMSPAMLPQAELIILGVSRTGKTPLSVVLAQTMGLKVSNIPLVVDLPPPRQLFDKSIDPRRVFCLTLDPDDLMKIRKTRIQRELRFATKEQRSTYANKRYLLKDINNAKQLALEHGFTEIDVTGRAVEETASLISSLLNERFGELD